MSVNTISGLVFSAISGLLLWVAYLPHEDSLSSSLDSMYWPRVILWALLFFSLVLSTQKWWNIGGLEEVGNGEGGAEKADRIPITSLLCCVAYFFSLGLLGFLISTFLFCAAFAVLIGHRDWKQLAVFSFGVTAVVWLVVIKLMQVSLPRGIWIFRDISLFFY